MTPGEALDVLGVDAATDWESVRRAYRAALHEHHPDHHEPDGPGAASAAGATDRIVTAFRTLRELTGDGATPLSSVVAPLAAPGPTPVILHARPGDVFVRMFQAASVIGHVAYADRDARLMQVILNDGEWAASQLTVEITPEDDHSTALFSLEPIGSGEAPPIEQVVDRLATTLRAASVLDGH